MPAEPRHSVRPWQVQMRFALRANDPTSGDKAARYGAPDLICDDSQMWAARPVSAHDDHQNSNYLFRLHQSRNNRSNFFEYLVPALQLPAILCALHGFISDVSESRLAVPEILKDGHVVRTLDGLMFYS